VKEGVVLPFQKSKKKFFLFLLNNLLVITKTSSKSDKCKVVELVHNKHLEIEELNDGKVAYFRFLVVQRTVAANLNIIDEFCSD